MRALVTGPKFLKLGSKEFQDFVCVSSFRNDERFARPVVDGAAGGEEVIVAAEKEEG